MTHRLSHIICKLPSPIVVFFYAFVCNESVFLSDAWPSTKDELSVLTTLSTWWGPSPADKHCCSPSWHCSLRSTDARTTRRSDRY